MVMMGNVLERGRAKSHCWERWGEGDLYMHGGYKSEETRTNSFIFFLYGKKGGEEVDELVDEQNTKCELKIPHAQPGSPGQLT